MVAETRQRRHNLWRVASGQRGYFTAAQALGVGYSYQAQRFHVMHGNWSRVDRGVYRLREFEDLPQEDTDAFVRWSLWSGERAVVSHTSALATHDLGTANPARVHLTVDWGFRKKNPAVVLHRAELADRDITRCLGFRITTPVRAVAESAEAGADQDLIDGAVSDVLERGIATRRQLLEAAQRAGARAELAVSRAVMALRS